MKRFFLIFLLVLVAVVVAGIFFLLGSFSQKEKISFYKISDGQRPRLKIAGESFKDLGKMKLSDEKTVLFPIKNEGEARLEIFYGSSSCGCTSGQLKTKEKSSPVFDMHSNNQFYFELAPGEEGEVELIYKPSLMPAYGKVQRAVMLKSNDPENPQVSFSIEALVE